MADVLDLFGGAGGAAVGLHLLGLTEVGIEWGEDECASRRAAGFEVTQGDVAAADPADYAGIEGLWMSPPCPDWSVAGKGAGMDGESGWLVNEVPRWVRAIRPRWVACENVPPVLPIWQEFTHLLADLGYRTWAGCLSSEEYGVPQTRNRAYLLAHRDRPVGAPTPSHQPYVFGEPAERIATLTGVLRPWVSMAEALGWAEGRVGFPRLDDTGTSEDGYRDRDWRQVDEPAFNLTEKARSWTLNTGADWKPDGDRTSAQTRESDEPAPTVRHQSISWQLIPGGGGYEGGGNRRPYSGDEPAPTIAFGHDASTWVWRRPATTIAGDPRVFQPGGHHQQGQQSENAIRVEPWEALVLQSMPANYPMQGSRTAQFRQIGNLVPPFMVTALVGEMLGLDWLAAIDSVTGGR